MTYICVWADVAPVDPDRISHQTFKASNEQISQLEDVWTKPALCSTDDVYLVEWFLTFFLRDAFLSFMLYSMQNKSREQLKLKQIVDAIIAGSLWKGFGLILNRLFLVYFLWCIRWILMLYNVLYLLYV